MNAGVGLISAMYQGARSGAANGAMLGATAAATVVPTGFMQAYFERLSRDHGSDPRWPFFENDCSLPQFRDVTMCTTQPLFASFTSLTISFVGASTLCGMAYGAVSAGIKYTRS